MAKDEPVTTANHTVTYKHVHFWLIFSTGWLHSIGKIWQNTQEIHYYSSCNSNKIISILKKP